MTRKRRADSSERNASTTGWKHLAATLLRSFSPQINPREVSKAVEVGWEREGDRGKERATFNLSFSCYCKHTSLHVYYRVLSGELPPQVKVLKCTSLLKFEKNADILHSDQVVYTPVEDHMRPRPTSGSLPLKWQTFKCETLVPHLVCFKCCSLFKTHFHSMTEVTNVQLQDSVVLVGLCWWDFGLFIPHG